jgi:hypothetical protein
MAKRGRPRKNLPFEEARDVARSENIGSVAQYIKWHDLNKPAGLPRRPDRAYKNDFITWNDFLGNNTPFPCKPKKYRPFDEARAFAQSLRLSTKNEWLNFAGSNDMVEDIPKRPDLYYRDKDEWISWGNFLGINIREKSRNLMEATFMFFIMHNPKADRDYYKCGMTAGGISSIRDYLMKVNGKLVAAYHVPDTFQYKKFMEDLGINEHYEYKDYFHIVNMIGLMSKLSMEFNRVSSQNS